MPPWSASFSLYALTLVLNLQISFSCCLHAKLLDSSSQRQGITLNTPSEPAHIQCAVILLSAKLCVPPLAARMRSCLAA
jgi:hypothetical protein